MCVKCYGPAMYIHARTCEYMYNKRDTFPPFFVWTCRAILYPMSSRYIFFYYVFYVYASVCACIFFDNVVKSIKDTLGVHRIVLREFLLIRSWYIMLYVYMHMRKKRKSGERYANEVSKENDSVFFLSFFSLYYLLGTKEICLMTLVIMGWWQLKGFFLYEFSQGISYFYSDKKNPTLHVIGIFSIQNCLQHFLC